MSATRRTKKHSPLGFALLAYMLFITSVITLLPFRFQMPDRFIVWYHTTTFDVITNVFLFIPIGFLYSLTRRGDEDPWRLRALVLGLLISFVIEFAQIFMSGRYSSTIDLVANGTGAWVGGLFHVRVKRRLNEQLVGELALELPLMNLFYLLIPLLWINTLATGYEPARLWTAPILGLFGGMILTAVWKYRLKPAGILSENTLAFVVCIWFLLASLPELARKPKFLTCCGLGVAIVVRLMATFWRIPDGNNRRFELPTLLRILPLYASYLFLIALWPWPWIPGGWRASLGFANLTDIPGMIPTWRLLEYVIAFTLLGYMVSEARGRKRETFLHAMKWVFLYCLAGSGGLEVIRGFHPKHIASLAQLIMATSAGLYGGAIYRVQLATVQELLAEESSSSSAIT